MLDEFLAVCVVHLAEQLFAELVIALNGLAFVDFSDDLLLFVDVLLDLSAVFLKSSVTSNHVKSFKSTSTQLVLLIDAATDFAQSFIQCILIAGLLVRKLGLQLFRILLHVEVVVAY